MRRDRTGEGLPRDTSRPAVGSQQTERLEVATTDVPLVYRLSDSQMASIGRLDALREMFGSRILRAEFDPVDTSFKMSLRTNLKLLVMPGLKVVDGPVGGAIVRRTKSFLTDGNDDISITLESHGRVLLEQRAASAELRAGQAAIVTNAEAFSALQIDSDAVRIGVPRRVLAPFVPHIEDRLATILPAGNEALRLLRQYIRLLTDGQPSGNPDLNRLAVTHVYDLVALAIGASRDAAAFAAGRGLRAARFHAIKADIAGRIGAGPVSADDIAARHRISPRYVRRLFEYDGTSLSAFVTEQRLLRARRMLTAPHCAAMSISTIAYEAGFSDLSYFNRVFRRRFGATPSEVRAREVE